MRNLLLVALALSACQEIHAQTAVPSGYWDDSFGPEGVGGQGVTSQAMAVARNPVNGDIYVGGEFNIDESKREIVRWDGSQWVAVGMGTNSTVFALEFSPDGTLYVGGSFTSVRQTDGTELEALRIAAWDGSSWSALGTGASSDRVSAIAFDEVTGRVYIGGSFDHVINGDGAPVPSSAIAYWDGSLWNPVGQGADEVRVIAIDPNNGDVLVGSQFLDTGYNSDGTAVDMDGLGAWDGSQWMAFGNPVGFASALEFDTSGRLYVAGRFSEIGGQPAINVARYTGTTWEAPGGAVSGPAGQEVTDILVETDGMFAVGRFVEVVQADGSVEPIQRIAYLDFTTGEWLPLGPTRYPDSFINELAGTADEIWVVGAFRDIGGRPADRVSRWFRSERPYPTTVSTFSVDLRSARRHGLFNFQANIMMEVTGGDTEGYYILEDADRDTVYTVVTEQTSGSSIDYSFLIDRDGNSEGEGFDWIRELDYPQVGRKAIIPSTGPFDSPTSLFDDRDPAGPHPGATADAVEILSPTRLGRTLAFFGDIADRLYYDADFIDRITALTIHEYQEDPGGSLPSGIARIADHAVWRMETWPAAADYALTLDWEYQNITGIREENSLRVLHRGDPGDPWVILPTEVLIADKTLRVPNVTDLSGEWTIGSVTPENPLTIFLPAEPAGPSPGDGTLNTPVAPTLGWNPVLDAAGYEVRFWLATDPEPVNPVVRPTQPSFAPGALVDDVWYNWRVQSVNIHGEADGPVWSFRVGKVPDLQVSSVAVPPEGFSGQPIQVSWTVSNTGQNATNAPKWIDRVYLSGSSNLDTDQATLLASPPNLSFLNPGETYTNSVTVLLPEGIQGTHYMHVDTDGRSPDDLVEEDESNNVGTSAAMTVTLTPFADLEVTNVIAPDVVFSGDSINVLWTARNVGNGQTDVSEWTDALFLSIDDVFDFNFTNEAEVIRINEVLLTVNGHDGTLEAGEEYTTDVRLRLPDDAFGDHYLFVAADVEGGAKQPQRGNVYEFNQELDNWTSEPISITLRPPPDLIVSTVLAPAVARSGQSVDVSWTVSNVGPGPTATTSWSDLVHYSPTPEFDSLTAVVLGSFANLRSLDNDSSYTQSKSIRLPDGVSGAGYFLVTTDWRERVFEHTFDDNNSGVNTTPTTIEVAPYPDLKVESVTASPAGPVAGGQIAVHYTVRNAGNLATPSVWTDSIFVSNQSTWDRGDAIPVAAATQPNEVDVGGARSNRVTIDIPTDLEGDHFVFVKSNAADTFFEYPNTERNEAASGAITISAYPPVDLVAEVGPIDGPVQSGGSMSISATVRNLGQASTRADSWIDRIYLSTDSSVDPELDIQIAEFQREGSLSAGASYRYNRSIDSPNGLEGAYFVLFSVDADGLEPESDETNNVRSVSASLTLPAPADLRIIELQAPASAAAGEPVTIGWTVENVGAGVTDGDRWFDAVYLSTDRAIGRGDVLLGSRQREAALVATSSYVKEVRTALPAFSAGSYYVIAQVDSRDDIYEHLAEGNNLALGQIDLILPDPADLVVENVVAPSVAEPGQPVEVSWTIRNVGSNPAAGLIRDAVFVSSDTEWSPDDPLLGVLEREIDLAPGASGKASLSVDIAATFRMDAQGNITEEMPGVTPGDYHVIVRGDAGNSIRETIDGNNWAASATSLAATLALLSPDSPESLTLTAGQSRYYQFDVIAGADARLTIDSNTPESGNELYVAAGRMPTAGGTYDYAAAAPFVANQELVIPSTAAGLHYLLVVTRSLPETAPLQTLVLKQENAGFEIESVSPKRVGQGRVTTTVAGTGLLEIQEVYLSDGEDVQVNGIVTANPNSTVCRIRWDLESVPLGTYNLTILRSGGETAMLMGSVEVVAVSELTTRVEIVGPERIRADGKANFFITLENTSNVDIPHVSLSVFANRTESMTIDSELFTLDGFLPSDVLADALRNDVLLDPADALIPLVGRNLEPGEKRTASIGFSGFYDPLFEISAQAAALTSEQALEAWTMSVEAVRQEILEEPGFDPIFVTLAEDPERFRNTMLFNLAQYGLIDDSDIPRPTTGKILRAAKTQRQAAGGPCFCIEYDVDFDTGEPTCVRAECPPDQPTIEPLPPGFPEPPGGPPLTCEQQRAQTQACVDRWTDRCRQPANCIGSIASCSFKTKVWWAGPACGVLCALVKNTEICDPNWSTSIPRLICPPVDSSCDPNDIIGPDGFSDEKWVGTAQMLPYTIRFENDPELATASAQVVGITHALDPDVDERSFRLGEFGFGPLIFEPPANSAFFRDRVDATDSLGVLVDVTAGIDVTRNEAFWRFTSIDPATGDQPINDPTAGFLPVNDDRGSGEGFVTYTIRADEAALTGDVIDAQAEIVFDINAPIETPPIFNTLDASPPTSSVNVLTGRQDSVVFDISWTGQDAGSGVRDYTLYSSLDGGPFEPVETAVSDTSRLYVGEIGHTYRFFTIARDNVGNVEPMKTEGEAVTVVSTEEAGSEIPEEFALYQNFPNPFNPTTTIPFDLADSGDVEITLFDVLGRRVQTVDRGNLAAGRYQQIVDMSSFASGVYLYQIRVVGEWSVRFRDVGKLVLVK